VPRLKVLTLVERLTAVGGGERVAIEIATRLDPERFESVLTTTRARGGVDLDPSEPVAASKVEASGIRLIELGRRSTLDLGAWSPLVRLLRRERFDVLHSHKFGSNVWGTLIGRLARVPVIIAHEHSWSFDGQPLRRVLDRELISRGSNVIVAVSAQDRRRMIEIEGVRPDKVLFVPNGIPRRSRRGTDVRAALGIPPDAPVIGTVGLLRPEKALDLLIRAAAPLLTEMSELRVLIAGDGPDKEPLRELARRHGMADRVMLIGFRDDVPDVLAALDVAVSSSVSEGGPLAVMEFMEAARPIVATRVGGVPDLIDDGVHGLLVPPGDTDALTAALRRVLADRDAARRMGERARERRSREFDIDVAVGRFESLYERLRAGHDVPSSVAELDAGQGSVQALPDHVGSA
jgi:glycosyltransferase involved in cell wall biosynthesis